MTDQSPKISQYRFLVYILMRAIESSSHQFSINAHEYASVFKQELMQSLSDFISYLSLDHHYTQTFDRLIQDFQTEDFAGILSYLNQEPITIESKLLFEIPEQDFETWIYDFVFNTLKSNHFTQTQTKHFTPSQHIIAQALMQLLLDRTWHIESKKKLKQDIFPIIVDYEIKAFVAENYYAKTYIAAQLNEQGAKRLCLLKITELENQERFEQESIFLTQVKSPHLLPYLDLGILSYGDKTKLWVTLACQEWISIEDLLDQQLSTKIQKVLIDQLLTALTTLHEHHILHKDLRPSHCLISPNLEIQLSCFGLSKSIPEDSRSYATLPTHAITTPAYLSPEQLLGREQLTVTSDIWSIAMIIFEIFTADLPWGKQINYFKMTSNIQKLKVPIDHIKDLGYRGLYEIFHRCFSKNPHQRYSTVLELKQDLEKQFEIKDQSLINTSTIIEIQETIPSPKKTHKYWLFFITIALILTLYLLSQQSNKILLSPAQIPMILVKSNQIQNFYISQSEITVKQYQSCIDAGVCKIDLQQDAQNGWLPDVHQCNYGKAQKEHYPMNCISWEQARVFSKWANAEIISESQWEYVASINRHDQNIYPWGNMMSCEYAVISDLGDGCGMNESWAVCQRPQGNIKLPSGEICDLFGNVSEWTLDELPSSALHIQRISKGGHWKDRSIDLEPSHRTSVAEKLKSALIGLRIVKEIE